MANYLFTKKLIDEIDNLVNCKQKNYCFILAENQEDEAMQVFEHKEPNTIFIIVRKDRWKIKSQTEL